MKTSKTRENPGAMQWSPMLVLSLSFHVALFLTLLLVPESFSTRRPLGGITYEVDLVEMPGGGASRPRTAPSSKEEGKTTIPKDTKAKRIEESTQKQEKPLIIAKKTAEKEVAPTKKPEVSPSELIEKAISKIEKKVKTDEHLDQALAKIEQKAAERGSTAGGGSEGKEKTGGGVPGTILQIYLMEVETLIKSNWAYPASMESKKDLEATVVIMVKSDGTIMNTRFDKRSTSSIFDDSVMKAVERSNPLPPFPQGYKVSQDEFWINFNLKDLKGDN